MQAGAETSDTGSEAEPDPGCPLQGHSGGVGADVGYESTESRNLGGSNLNTKQNYVMFAISNCKTYKIQHIAVKNMPSTKGLQHKKERCKKERCKKER